MSKLSVAKIKELDVIANAIVEVRADERRDLARNIVRSIIMDLEDRGDYDLALYDMLALLVMTKIAALLESEVATKLPTRPWAS